MSSKFTGELQRQLCREEYEACSSGGRVVDKLKRNHRGQEEDRGRMQTGRAGGRNAKYALENKLGPHLQPVLQ
ncbi:hypothetical protein CRENBAI_005740 [Crenichthys baileyi]|uniref:Uncharacterized protein n=1 Tax=Crenichthys baileyi TaxID=28760 RepID=A0AAV9R2N9_9TELE